ncbi:hypothetical protein TL16_g07554 [Triparma laevis f. inornata]|uniref:Uncharacterized protein n=1 Tax=Triparma laevis f. inornata TaxID=1714386 RepID=A0A9W7EGC4_9STRA|nr:hypothetical protein TL16_g07554 [Triparma laevis f. inornata]
MPLISPALYIYTRDLFAMTLIVSALSVILVVVFATPSSKSAGNTILGWHDELYNTTVGTIVHVPGQKVSLWAPGLEANVTGVHHLIAEPIYPIVWMAFRWFAGVGCVFHAIPWKIAKETLVYAIPLYLFDGVLSYITTIRDQNNQIEADRYNLEYNQNNYYYTQLLNLLVPVIYCALLGHKLKDNSIWKRMVGLGIARAFTSFFLFASIAMYNRAKSFTVRVLIRTVSFYIIKVVAIHLEAWFILGFKDARDDTRIISACFLILICGTLGRLMSIGAGTGETVIIEIILIIMELMELDDYIRGQTVIDSYAAMISSCLSFGRGKKNNAITPADTADLASDSLSTAKRAFFGDAIVVYGVGEATGVIVGSAFALANAMNMSEPGGEPYPPSTVLTNLAIVLLCEVFLADFAVAAWSTVEDRDRYLINKFLPKAKKGKTVNLVDVWSNRITRHKLRFFGLLTCCALCASFFGVGIYTYTACLVRRGVEFGDDEWMFSACPDDSLCALSEY